MPKIIHAADFHLDSAFGGLSADRARERRRESRELADRLADLVRAEGAEVVLLAGDLFDGERVYPETLERLKAALAGMGCPVFISPGNHDPYTPHSPYAAPDWPENVHIFRSEAMEAVLLPDLDCVVHGAAFTLPERTDLPLAGFAAPRDDGRVHLLCLHGDVGNPGSPYGPILREQLADSGVQYAALGHVHQYSGILRDGGTFWAYPGCPEGRGFDELGDKGVLAGTVDRRGAEMRFVPLCRRRYRILEADVTDASPREALEAVMPETAENDICRIIFTGEAEEDIDLFALESVYREKFYSLELRDKTRPAQALWDRAGEDTLRGLFLQEMKGRYDAAPTEEAREEITLAVRFALAAMEGRDIG